MNRILEMVQETMTGCLREQLSEVPLTDLEENGTVYYMNGRNGTEFDWYVNGKLSDFFIFYDNEAKLGAVKTSVYHDGGTMTYVYGDGGNQMKAEIPGRFDVTEEELLSLAVTLRREADDKKIWDSAIGQIDSEAEQSEASILQFVSNRQYYESMIRRKLLFGQFAYVSRRILDEKWNVGYMNRDEGLNEDDSGWSFLAGNEDDAYLGDPANIALLHVAEVCQLDEAVWKHIDAPAGSSFIRISAGEFEEDHGDREIWLSQRD
ncbi:MAG: DUF2185 domain-containing protein [Mogibacterium sp.]|nr:DUF2185 domain-containing protein [Mogibacterium sp.]